MMKTSQKYKDLQNQWRLFIDNVDETFKSTFLLGTIIFTVMSYVYLLVVTQDVVMTTSLKVYAYLGCIVLGSIIGFLLALKRSGMLVK